MKQFDKKNFHWYKVLLISSAAYFFKSILLYANQEINVDVCVYGGTSGGVVAAVQAARMGKSVALINVGNHLGGMLASGLGNPDIGNFGNSYIQGVAREFYTRIGQKYGNGIQFTFEPHVAEAVFNDMIQQSGVAVYTNQYLTTVARSGQQIIFITMNNGNLFRAKMFIDCSYEGDLMVGAGVSYTIGREAASQYGESLNGVCAPNSEFGSLNVNPYLITNNPAGGLVPLMQSNSLAAQGSADQLVQAYNFRMCLTQSSTNMLPITAPTNYTSAQYELLGRYIQAMTARGTSLTLGNFINIFTMPNGKTDVNNGGAISTDFIGQSSSYPQADYVTRTQIWQAHKNYLQGLLYFLATDPRVPTNVQSQMLSYGLCKDEFIDNGGWPYLIYVREARRMISDYVMTQSNCFNQAVAQDSIGLAAYGMDSHTCERLVVNGYAQNEGPLSTSVNTTQPYPVSYRSIVPKSVECTNLLVPWCLSASHVAFDSLRMEPVFMILSQSAATAACFAIDDGVAVQQVNLTKLQAQLMADQQQLQWANSANNASNLPVVNLWAKDATASRFGPQAGSFTVSRTVNTNTTLTVYFYIGGTATYGYDCQYLANSLIIPAGVASTNISVIPYTNALPVGDKTITFSLISSAVYMIGSLASAVVTIKDTPINEWRLQFFGTNATNSAIAGDLANPAGDGIFNLMKYALGLDPTVSESAGAMVAQFVDTNGVFNAAYTRPDPPPMDITYQVVGSNNLISWSTNSAGLAQNIVLNTNNIATVICLGSLPAKSSPNEFLRLQITRR